ncbi:methyltransferase family protein [Salsuginibacillus halophilus]|uniref:Methyltransferase family protein n=2 Tax=Salsuginibacillus halophilus TaxID=517424 RepID=A0A2P8HCK0_9BACI|nr:methyltransferase family protein [Salsuginibacillus halophilus]
MLIEHLARYHFAVPYVHGRTLDIACGAGYGTKLLAKKTKKQGTTLVGADIDEASLTYARANYHHPNTTFSYADVNAPNALESLGMFDTIVSFETIEHVPSDETFIAAVTQCLKPGGTLIVSTPFGNGRGEPTNSPFHYHQLTEAEFLNLFKAFHAELFYQSGPLIESTKRKKHYPLGIAVAHKPI